MQVIFVLLVALLFLPFKSVHAQSGCATITSVSVTTSSLDPNSDNSFDCSVGVDDGHAGSRTIACGISINGSWPQNYCPSDSNFKGWSGSTAKYGCNVPAGAVASSDKVEVVGFDFSGDCGPDGGKKESVSVKKGQSGNNGGNTGSPGSQNPGNGNNGGNNNTGNTTPNYPNQPPKTVCEALPSAKTQCGDNTQCLKEFISPFIQKGDTSGNNGGNNNTGNNGTSPTSTPPSQPPPAQGLRSWEALFSEVGQKVNVPPLLLQAIKEAETGTWWMNLTPDEFENYTKAGGALPDSQCIVSTADCGEAGPMQVTTDRDGQGNLACPKCCPTCTNRVTKCPNTFGGLSSETAKYSNPSPNACNIKDNVYASALLLKRNSGVSDNGTWTDDNIIRAIHGYGSNCDIQYKHLGGRTYCDWAICKVHQRC